MRVRFFGVRGSYPCPRPDNARYGGNTASVSVDADPAFPILFDLGTGVTRVAPPPHAPLSALVSHLHFDHIQGLPFFARAHTPGARLDVYAPQPDGMSLEQAMADLIRPPYFPVPLARFPADLHFHGVSRGRFDLGQATVTVRPVPHTGSAVGYRVDYDGRSVAYVSDHQAPNGLDTVAEPVLELCEGVDLLIHDGQYTDEEFAAKSDWGHCTAGYAVLVARTAGARCLCLFHHDPSHGDADVDGLLASARDQAAGAGLDVIAAAEGLALTL